MPIKLKGGSGALSLSSANNVKPATTLIESGSMDGLVDESISATVDGGGDGASSDTVTASITSSGGGSGGSGSSRNAPMTKEAMDRINNVRTALEPQSLWEAIICGIAPSLFEGSFRGLRLDFTALWQRQGNCSAEDILDLVQIEDGSISIDRDELDRRVEMILGPVKDLLGEDQKQLIAGSVASQVGTLASDGSISLTGTLDANGNPINTDVSTTKIKINGTQTSLSPHQFEDAQSFTKLLSAADDTIGTSSDTTTSTSGSTSTSTSSTGTTSDSLAATVDSAVEFAVMDALVSKAIELQVPEAVDAVLSKIPDEGRKRRILLRNLYMAVLTSNLNFVQRVIDAYSRQTVLNRMPNIISLLLKYYSWGLGVSSDQYPQKRDDLLNILTAIDPDWYLIQRNGQMVSDLRPYSVASDRARTLLKLSPTHFLSATIAPTYPSIPVEWAAKKYYPKAMLAK